MRYMDRVLTASGPGVVVGVSGDGGLVCVCIARGDLVGRVCKGPCVNLMMRAEAVTSSQKAVIKGQKAEGSGQGAAGGGG